MTVFERLQTVEALAKAETGEAIPELARLERQATGWGCIALVGMLGFAAAAALLFALSSILLGWGALVVQLLGHLLQQLAPRWADDWLVVILLVTAIAVLCSARWRALMQDKVLWQHTRTADVTGYAHLAVSAPARASMTLLAASFLPFTLFAPVYVLTQWRLLSASILAALRTALPTEWAFIANWLPYALLALAPFLYVDWKRRAPRWVMIGLTFVLCGYLAVVWLLEGSSGINSFALNAVERWPLRQADSGAYQGFQWFAVAPLLFAVEMLWYGLAQLLTLSWFWSPLALYLTLGLTYPLGLGYVVARIFYWPYALFRNTWGFVAERAHLRRRLSRVLNDHLGRNKQRVRGDGWGTVCSNHLQRFVEGRSRRAYLRPVVYHLCPICQQDTHAYNNIACVSVLLDESMTTPVRRLGPTLYLNGLWWSEKPAQAVEAPFESLVIGPADHLAIEGFVIHYEGASSVGPALKDVPCYSVAGHSLHDNTRPMLVSKVKDNQIVSEFELTDTAVPCLPGMRQRVVAKRVLRRGLRLFLALLVLAALLAAARLALLWLWSTLLN